MTRSFGVLVSAVLILFMVSQPLYLDRQNHGALAANPDFNFGVAGDWAGGTNSMNTANNMAGHDVELAIGLGDYAYTTGTPAVNSWWDNIMTPLHGKFKGALGNHDGLDQATYASVFGQTSWYFSFDYQNIHFVIIDPHQTYSPGSAQYNFVSSDLAAASSNTTIKWIVAAFHEPMYTSPSTHPASSGLRNAYHPLFDQYGVDLVLTAHNHNYQRTYPLKYNNANASSPTITTTEKTSYTDPAGEIYVLAGTGGQVLYPLNGQSSFVTTEFADTYGFLNLDVVNNGLTLKGTYYANDGSIKDAFTIDKSGSGSPPPPTNTAPTANAGPDQTVNEGFQVALTGAGSSDPDGNSLTYSWVQTEGPTVSLTGADTVAPSFTAPQVTVDTSLSFQLTVNDGSLSSSPDTVKVTVKDTSSMPPPTNNAPVANAGSDRAVPEGTSVTLDGSASSDPDGDNPLTYGWTQTDGPPVTLSGATSSNPAFTAPQVNGTTALVFSLVVSDSKGLSSTNPDSVKIDVLDTPPGPLYNYAPYRSFTGSSYQDTSSTLALQLQKFSVVSWFSTIQDVPNGSNAFIMNKGGSGSERAGKNMNYGIWLSSSENIRAGFETTSGTDNYVTSPLKYNDGNWHYAAATYNGTKLVLYIDGTQVATKSTTAVPDNTGSQPFRYGANSLALNGYFIGNVDESRVWNRTLSSSEVASAYNTGTFDISGQVLYQPFS